MTYHRPTQLRTALALAAQGEAKLIAGGTDLYPAAGHGALVGPIIDLTRIGGLSGITPEQGGYRIGGATTWTELVRTELPTAFDGLKAAARDVGSIQIQNAGTVAGNLCNASPAADGIPPLLTLDAEVELESATRGKRRLALAEFVTGVRQTARAPDEILVAILIPPLPLKAVSAFEKLGSRKYLVISIAMTAALVVIDDEGLISDVRLAVGACSAVARRLPSLETRLVGLRPDEVRIDPASLSELSPIDDVRGTADFRREVAAVQLERALRRACGHE